MGSHLKLGVIGHILILLRHQHVNDRVSAFLDHYVTLLLQNLWPAHITFRQEHYKDKPCSLIFIIMIKTRSPALILIQQDTKNKSWHEKKKRRWTCNCLNIYILKCSVRRIFDALWNRRKGVAVLSGWGCSWRKTSAFKVKSTPPHRL